VALEPSLLGSAKPSAGKLTFNNSMPKFAAVGRAGIKGMWLDGGHFGARSANQYEGQNKREADHGAY